MKRTTILFFLFIACFISNPVFSQTEKKWPKTLLWKISGNGLSKPSYLFGTIHLQDKRVFYFSDSLYHFLEKADGYALEVNLSEIIDSVVQRAVDSRNDEVKDEESELTIDTTVSVTAIERGKVSKKKLIEFRKQMIKAAAKNEQMPTIVDAYLYGIARRHGKWVGSVEDVQDQLPLLNEFGQEVSGEDFKTSDITFTNALERMIQIYIQQDISGIEEFCRSDLNIHAEDTVMVRRNKKMAVRMDSLAHIRSMFFAVGAAHLGGEKGVIKLLRAKGFVVEPVFSTKRIEPLQYASKLAKLPWEKVQDENRSFEIEMPGMASNLNLMGDVLKLKFNVDITTLTYYMAGSILSQPNVDLKKIIDKVTDNRDAKLTDIRSFEKDGLKGIEGIMYTEGVYFKVQYLQKGRLLYMLMAGNEKKQALKGEDAKRFFLSFVPGNMPIQVSKEWQLFTEKEKAFSVSVPGVVKRNQSIDRKSIGSEWSFATYDCYDSLTSTYYLIQARDTRSGYFLMGDSAFFESIKEILLPLVDTVYEQKMMTWNGFPAYWMYAKVKDQELNYWCRVVNRGNRVYMLLAAGSPESEGEKGPTKFFESFAFNDYSPAEWKQHSGPGFYSTTPSVFRKKAKVKTDDDTNKDFDEYVSYNSSDVTSYHIIRQYLGPYYWTKNDSSFYEFALNGYRSFGDSVLWSSNVQNGNVKGQEWILHMKANNLRKKARQFIHGDTLYTVLAFIPSQYLELGDHRRFFEDFRFTDESITPSIYQSKINRIFTDLNSVDSATYVAANDALNEADFEKKDVSFLLDKLFYVFPADTMKYSWQSPGNYIQNALERIIDSSHAELIQKKYLAITKDHEQDKWTLLDILASNKTRHSYDILKSLLLKNTPAVKNNKYVHYSILRDSLELAVGLYPEILELSSDTVFNLDLSEITGSLLDSNLINVSILQPYKGNFLKLADAAIVESQQSGKEFLWYDYNDLIEVLTAFNDDECNKKLKELLSVNFNYFRENVVYALLRNNQQIPQKYIDSLAMANETRRTLYNELAKRDKVKLFPAKYLNQRSLAESDLHIQSEEDYGPGEYQLVGVKEVVYKNVKSRFFLFKMIYRDEDGKTSESEALFGVAGPYSLDAKDLKTDNSATGIVYEVLFDPKKIDQMFMNYLKSLEED